MKFCSSIFKGFFNNGLAYIFLFASIFVYAIVVDWAKIEKYINRFDETNCEPYYGEKISFGLYSFVSSPPLPNPFKIIEYTFYFLSIPSFLINEFLISDVKSQNPFWCPETFDFISMFSFLIINSVYWLFLGYIIEKTHDYYSKNKPNPEKPFSIFEDSE